MSTRTEGDRAGASLSLHTDSSQVAWLTFEPGEQGVNVLSGATLRRLDRILAELESLTGAGKVAALVLRSARPGTFLAGADVREIAALESAEDARAKSAEGQRIFSRLERLPVPTVAAVDGTCLGGGTEIALACDYRVASDGDATKFGLPEVQLGILPGFGGTVRLPHLCGIRNALDLILTGRSVSADRARRIGLVERILPAAHFQRAVSDFVQEVMTGGEPPVGYRKSLLERILEQARVGRILLFSAAGKRTRARTEGHYPAPLRALEVIQEGYSLSPDRAYELESRALGELAMTPESRNLVRLFLLGQGLKRQLSEEQLSGSREVRRAAVLGAGVMGGSIAELVASHDVPLVLKDIDQRALDEGLRHANELLRRAASKGVFSEADAGRKYALIEGTLDYDDLGSCDLVVEAVVEQLSVKRQVLGETEGLLAGDAVFATNTSSLSVDELADAAASPERVVGLHFFNPVHKMPLVEVVRGPRSSAEAVATAFAFARELDKKPVVVSDGPGFLVNRLLAPYLNEAGFLLSEGVTIEELDRAFEDFGLPMGPCRLLDEVGLDVASHVSHQLSATLGDRMRSAPVVERLMEIGHLGRKNSRGFYLYDRGKRKKVAPAVRRALEEGREGEPAAVPSVERIRERGLYPMVNEAAFALSDGIVQSGDLVDLAMVLGTGFPPFLGGPLRWADGLGLARIVETLEELAGEIGPRFRPAPRLREMAGRGERFTDGS